MTLSKALASSFLLLALSASGAWGSRADDPQEGSKPSQGSDAQVCTDLSGKYRAPCPGEKSAGEVAPPAVPATPPAKADGSANNGGTEPIHLYSPTPRRNEEGPARQPGAVVPAAATAAPPVPTPATPAAANGAGLPDAHMATTNVAETATPVRRQRSIEWSLPANLLQDQKNIWTSPLHLRLSHVQWLVPLLGGTALVIANDRGIESHLPTSASFIKHSNSFSNYGAVAFAGLTGGAYVWSRMSGNEHMREASVLSGEAAVNTLALTFVMKSITRRERPTEGGGTGRFWTKGSSFPSEHAAAAWSIASVMAHEYPGPLTALLAYGGAGAISAARVTGRKHFASDALVGSALGWFVGREVYRAHHNRSDAAAYGTFVPAPHEGSHDPGNMGSPFVPLDSWVYSAIDRLSALGYVSSAFAGLRPWTRLECVRLVDEAALNVQAESDQAGSEALRLLRALQTEFAFESDRVASGRNYGARLESVYARVTGISGRPLTDGYNFGQTIINDYGRLYQEGANLVTGFSGNAVAGPLAFYVRGEYQHAPSAPAEPLNVRTAVAAMDFLPVSPALPIAARDRFSLLDAYVALNIRDNQISFGKQSLWWGPGEGGPMMFSNNIEPITMLRFNRVTPFTLPSILGWLGAVRTEFFIGQLAGHEFIFNPSGITGVFGHSLDPQPFIHGEKISFKPTPNFEFGVSRTTVFGGPGFPFTAHSFVRALFTTGNQFAGTPDKPGDRRSGFDFSYRLPGLRNWLTFYGDGFAEDEFSPIAYPDRSVWHAGLYLSHFPRLPKLDLRAEGVYTDNPLGGLLGQGFFYFNATWRNGYTNNGNLIGNWIGREGQGAQAWATYHFSPRSDLQWNYRHQKVSQEFLPGGGTLSDYGIRTSLWVRSTVSVSGFMQYEKWIFPLLAPGPRSNVTTSLQVTYSPKH